MENEYTTSTFNGNSNPKKIMVASFMATLHPPPITSLIVQPVGL